MRICKHCGTPVKIVTSEERPDDPFLWGEWTHDKIVEYITEVDVSNLPNHGCFFGCHYYLEGCYEQAEPFEEPCELTKSQLALDF